MIGRNIFGRDAERLNGVDYEQHLLDLGPPMQVQQDFATGIDMWQC